MKDRKVKQILSRYGYPSEQGEHKEKVKEGKSGGCNLHSCMKI
jgi:hypothetical protein